MSGLTGKKASTLKKENVKESKLLTTGVKSLRFWHEAQADGETSISFDSLQFPSDIQGESNPTSQEIVSANLGLFKNNVEVVSSLNGRLMRGLTYLVKNSQITFINNYEATEGEIFEVTYKNDVVTGTNVVDARPLTATGVLPAGDTDFAVGEVFKTNAYQNFQIGEVMVFVDGELQFRNVANAAADPSADGNYEEVHATGGYGSVIRFNEPFVEDKNIQVLSRNLIADRPDISFMQLIEKLGGQIDTLIEYVSQDIGVDPSVFQTAPNQVDLKAFGDAVFQNKTDISTNSALIDTILNAQVQIIKTAYLRPSASNFQSNQGASTGYKTGILSGVIEGDGSFGSISSNQLTLQAGTYKMRIPFGIGGGVGGYGDFRLRNITDSVDIKEYLFAVRNTTGNAINWVPLYLGFTITSSKILEFQTRATATGDEYLGVIEVEKIENQTLAEQLGL